MSRATPVTLGSRGRRWATNPRYGPLTHGRVDRTFHEAGKVDQQHETCPRSKGPFIEATQLLNWLMCDEASELQEGRFCGHSLLGAAARRGERRGGMNASLRPSLSLNPKSPPQEPRAIQSRSGSSD